MDHQRPNPDELLEQIREEEKAKAGGKLKIFFGYAAGVGKTYAMLEAAREQAAQAWILLSGTFSRMRGLRPKCLCWGWRFFRPKRWNIKA